jgi:putative PIN family toxin of toxin-antitoxin system
LIVFDTSTLIGAAIRRGSVPEQALEYAIRTDRIASSEPMLLELRDVLARPHLARFVTGQEAQRFADLLGARSVRFRPSVPVPDCRDNKDNKVLELALAAGAWAIIASDEDLLVLEPWRGVRILTPRAYLAWAAGRIT